MLIYLTPKLTTLRQNVIRWVLCQNKHNLESQLVFCQLSSLRQPINTLFYFHQKEEEINCDKLRIEIRCVHFSVWCQGLVSGCLTTDSSGAWLRFGAEGSLTTMGRSDLVMFIAVLMRGSIVHRLPVKLRALLRIGCRSTFDLRLRG